MIIPFPVSFRTALISGALATAFAGGWLVNGWRWEAKAADELRKQQETSDALQESDQKAIQAYRAVVDRLHSRPARRVYICPEVPGAALPGAGSSAPGVANPGAGEDIGPILRTCLTELYRYKALSNALQVRN